MIIWQEVLMGMGTNDKVEAESARGPQKTMSTNTADDTDAPVVDNEDTRYAELNIGDEEYVIYDRENHQAWIQSTVAFGLDNRR
jgi:hypothetical protein